MKIPDKNKPIRTVPDGAWEGGLLHLKKDRPPHRSPDEITTDFQGNGYPVTRQPE